ncbi:hypothetical protein IPC730_14000 [Pseudomonas aeruginosa]|nr:hypothetical protein APA63_30750 [Pseudomonas aeruginosa]OXT93727.1 hypothetical protein CF340_00290 [Pseudomonas aeruginosa]RPX05852.1 hypothetical protein IPC730_14000 [Pseudomonas aeruginosa]
MNGLIRLIIISVGQTPINLLVLCQPLIDQLHLSTAMNRPTICRTTGQRIGLCKCFRCRPPAPEQPETPQCPLPNTN